jgi:hypothetical protein
MRGFGIHHSRDAICTQLLSRAQCQTQGFLASWQLMGCWLLHTHTGFLSAILSNITFQSRNVLSKKLMISKVSCIPDSKVSFGASRHMRSMQLMGWVPQQLINSAVQGLQTWGCNMQMPSTAAASCKSMGGSHAFILHILCWLSSGSASCPCMTLACFTGEP